MRLDYVLALKIEDFLERRLQTQVFKLGLAKSIHHARVLIKQRHVRYVILLAFTCECTVLIDRHAVLASKSSPFLRSWFVWTRRSTLTLLSHRPTVVAALVVSSASVLPLLPVVRTKRLRRRMTSKLSFILYIWVGKVKKEFWNASMYLFTLCQ